MGRHVKTDKRGKADIDTSAPRFGKRGKDYWIVPMEEDIDGEKQARKKVQRKL